MPLPVIRFRAAGAMLVIRFRAAGAMLATAGAIFAMPPASAQTLAYGEPSPLFPLPIFEPFLRQQSASPQEPQALYETVVPEPEQSATAVPEHLRRQIVDYPTREPPGSIVIDTPNTYLYYVLGGGKAVRYGIGVGREGFTWSGIKSIGGKSEWPDWIPPVDMIARQPYLPRWTAGGPGNPLGARALYIAGTQYRVHGTNTPSSIGQYVSSGCIRMLNEDVIDLYDRVNIGAKVVVLPGGPRSAPVIAQDRPSVPASAAPEPYASATVTREPRAILVNSGLGGVY